jgi:hypothetical protein
MSTEAQPFRMTAQDAVPPTPVNDLRESHRQHASRSRLPVQPAPVPDAAAVPVAPVPVPEPPAVPPLEGCDGREPELAGHANGRLPDSKLCLLPGPSGEKLRADAAVDFVRLADAYKAALGDDVCVTDGYRTLSEQEVLRRVKPRLAARPGYSNHGWGQAMDLACGIQSYRSEAHQWMSQNAARFGWVLPEWATRTGSKPEPWHWEYIGS